MLETSQSTAKLDTALAKAQGEIEAASKDKMNPAFRSKYADLTAVWGAIRPALAKHGISVTQWPIHSEDSRLHIVTRIAHEGEWMRAHFSIPVMKLDSHGYGSATTYAKRFALSAAIGVVADEDDDGNAAAAAKPGILSAPITPTTGAKKVLSPDEIKKVDAVVSAVDEWMTNGQITDAVLTLENAGLIAEEKIYFWTCFDSQSRSAMKKEHERLKKEAADKLIPQQA